MRHLALQPTRGYVYLRHTITSQQDLPIDGQVAAYPLFDIGEIQISQTNYLLSLRKEVLLLTTRGNYHYRLAPRSRR